MGLRISQIFTPALIKKKAEEVAKAVARDESLLGGLIEQQKDADARLKSLQASRDKLLLENQTIEDSLYQMRERIKKVESAYQVVSSQYVDADARLKAARDSYAKLEKEAGKLAVEITQKKQDKDKEIKDAISTTLKNLESVNLRYDEKGAKLYDIEKQIANKQAILDKLVQDIKDNEQKQRVLVVDNDKLVKSLEEKRVSMGKASEKITGLHDEINRLKVEAIKKEDEYKEKERIAKEAEENLLKIKNITLGFVRRESQMQELIPKLKEMYAKAGLDIDL